MTPFVLLLLSFASGVALVAQPGSIPSPPLARRAIARMAPSPLFRRLDEAVAPCLRVTKHASALTSLAYFGLVSSSMQMPGARMPMASLAAFVTKNVGPTSNAAFASYFSTLVTPASYVFLIWPFIAFVQLLTLTISILRPRISLGGPRNSLEALSTLAEGEALSQSEIAALALANVAATGWLFASSNSIPGALPLASAIVLPLVPLFAGYPLRSATPPSALYRPMFQIFSSFTSIASCLAIVVELQYGGRVPLLAGRGEACGCLFLALVGSLISLPNRSLARRAITAFTLSGVVARRLAGGIVPALLLSPTFVGAVALLAWSLKQLVGRRRE